MTTLSKAPNKKIIVCCDGTWQNADSGYTKPSLIPFRPYGVLQVPSNVVRISRALKHHDFRGYPQIIYYQSGVGSSNSFVDKITGGLLGTGLSENIREAYGFITSNWREGDEIVLIGFSRGAYTARSVAGLIDDIGLLTREGMHDFYAIFKDNENSKNPNYHDIFPTVPFSDKPRGEDFELEYKRRLVEMGHTRTTTTGGRPIEVLAVAVWDTVGSLGIPSIGWLQKFGLPHATHELKFHDTEISNTIRHAFQALALEEHRGPFTPAVWELPHSAARTDLRQVWFPGAHSNVGGGYDDQEVANITLAWMMDQLASIGVEFFDETIDIIFEENRAYYEHPPSTEKTLSSLFKTPTLEWANPKIFDKYKPVRPWALGKIFESDTGVYHLTGRITRIPGQYKRSDPDTGNTTNIQMKFTNERIHSSVRVRLEMGGLDVDDIGKYRCKALLEQGPWELRRVRIKAHDAIGPDASWGGMPPLATLDDLRWVWEWAGPERSAPRETILLEDNLGPYERRLLLMNTGMSKVTLETAAGLGQAGGTKSAAVVDVSTASSYKAATSAESK